MDCSPRALTLTTVVIVFNNFLLFYKTFKVIMSSKAIIETLSNHTAVISKELMLGSEFKYFAFLIYHVILIVMY